MGTTLRVAGAQIPVTRHIPHNMEAIHRAIDFACEECADVLLTPEGSLIGHTHEFDIQAVASALHEVTSRAEACALALALGTCFVEPDDGLCYNQIRFCDHTGAYLGFHGKTLTRGSLTEPPKGKISHYAVVPLRTFHLKGITVGGLICNDLWANPGCTPAPDPHLTQQLAERRARVVFHAVKGGRDGSDFARDVVWPFHKTNLLMRACAGRLWIVTVDSCHPVQIPCSPPSGVVSPESRWTVRTEPVGERLFAETIEVGEPGFLVPTEGAGPPRGDGPV